MIVTPRRAESTIQPGQLRGLWAITSRYQQLAGITRGQAEEALRAVVSAVSGQDSTRRLTVDQADEVSRCMGEILRGAMREAAHQPRKVDPHAPVTPEQSQALLLLAGALGWNRKRLTAFVAKRMKTVTRGMPWPQTREEAMAIHEALEAMLWRRDDSGWAAIKRRATAALDLPFLTPWEVGFLEDLVKRRGAGKPHWKKLAKLAEIERNRGAQDDALETP